MDQQEAQEKAERGIELYRKKRELKKELKEIKSDLREYAEEQAHEDADNFEVETPTGNVLISFVQDSFYVSKMDEDDAQAMEMDLGFLSNALFDKKIKFKTKDDFREKMQDLSDSQSEKLMEYVTQRSNSSRVNFPK
jgi:hypothetical protein